MPTNPTLSTIPSENESGPTAEDMLARQLRCERGLARCLPALLGAAGRPGYGLMIDR